MVRAPSMMREICWSSHRILTWRVSCSVSVDRGIHGSRSRAAARSASALGWWASSLDCR